MLIIYVTVIGAHSKNRCKKKYDMKNNKNNSGLCKIMF